MYVRIHTVSNFLWGQRFPNADLAKLLHWAVDQPKSAWFEMTTSLHNWQYWTFFASSFAETSLMWLRFNWLVGWFKGSRFVFKSNNRFSDLMQFCKEILLIFNHSIRDVLLNFLECPWHISNLIIGNKILLTSLMPTDKLNAKWLKARLPVFSTIWVTLNKQTRILKHWWP